MLYWPPTGQQRWKYKAQIIRQLSWTSTISSTVNFNPASLLPYTKPTEPLSENRGIMAIKVLQHRQENKRWLCDAGVYAERCLAMKQHESKVHSRFFPRPYHLSSSCWTLEISTSRWTLGVQLQLVCGQWDLLVNISLVTPGGKVRLLYLYLMQHGIWRGRMLPP